MKSLNSARGLLGMLTLVLSVSCHSMGPTADDERFLNRPINERRELIAQYPMEKQVDLYLLAMERKHPPDLGLADVVAKGGTKIVPFLVKRLEQEERDIAKMQLIDVLERMQSLGYYTVAGDAATMAVLEYQVGLMKDLQWKAMSVELLARIKSHDAK